MGSPHSRSAALLISVYVDAEGGAPWYARLRAFDDPSTPQFFTERVSDKAQLILAIQRWLEKVLEAP